ncbi:MAG: hypothetical protein IID41_09000 [Planctomycetes bacterium]|nr:hypothetical protein [Planctomycetota bacterium]
MRQYALEHGPNGTFIILQNNCLNVAQFDNEDEARAEVLRRNEAEERPMYEVKCDECKTTIRKTTNVRESYAGGTCDPCRAYARALAEADEIDPETLEATADFYDRLTAT